MIKITVRQKPILFFFLIAVEKNSVNVPGDNSIVTILFITSRDFTRERSLFPEIDVENSYLPEFMTLAVADIFINTLSERE
jgi:hypothetical protein